MTCVGRPERLEGCQFGRDAGGDLVLLAVAGPAEPGLPSGMTNIAIVTGGGSGIGAAITRALAKRGDVVVIADIDEPAAKAVATEAGPLVSSTVLDVRDADAVATVVRDVAAEHGRLDLIFNNAGIAVAGPADELKLEHWDRVIDVNLRGVVHGM